MTIPALGIPDTWKFTMIVIMGFAVIFTGTEFSANKKRIQKRKFNINDNSMNSSSQIAKKFDISTASIDAQTDFITPQFENSKSVPDENTI